MARLEDRDTYLTYIAQFFVDSFTLQDGPAQLKEEIRTLVESPFILLASSEYLFVVD